jgi:hypothetical protein
VVVASVDQARFDRCPKGAIERHSTRIWVSLARILSLEGGAPLLSGDRRAAVGEAGCVVDDADAVLAGFLGDGLLRPILSV